MNRMNGVVGAACVLALLAGVQAYGCGESLFRAGFGFNIPAGKVDHPINIVIYAPSDNDVFFDDSKVASRLDKSGHKVTVLHTAAAAANTGDNWGFDVVLARDGDFDSAREAMGPRVANAVFVPVHVGFTKSDDSLSLSANAQLRQILGVLKLAMEAVQAVPPTA